MPPRIFVNIASYRDPDCRWTLESLFGKAKDPDRIFVGLCWQALPDQDADRYPVGIRAAQCRVIEVDARQSKGVCWARSQTQSLWRGEDYTLQIDSHMRFVQDWDAVLLDMLAACDAPKPVLSTYPPPFTPPDTVDSAVVTTMHAVKFDAAGILGLDSIGVAPDAAPAQPTPNPFCAGGFLFADSKIITEVPYDPHLYFHGEEITLAARLWTHGWDIFSPNAIVMYHDYNNHPGRERHWNDHQVWHLLNERAEKRVRHLLGMEISTDPAVVVDIARYGLGTSRSLASYEAYAEIDFATRLVKGKSPEEIEAAAPVDSRRRKMASVFGAIWKNADWGSEETKSGSGSTVAATAILRPKLLELFGFLNIASLIDVGCGELNWIRLITEDLRFYFGIDVVPDLLAGLRVGFRDRASHFFDCRDVTLDPLPAADAILCRDVLTHFPDYAVQAALSNIKASGARYLIATTHPTGTNAPIHLGGWRPMDLCGPPFNLPPPRILIRETTENMGKGLGVWQIGVLPDSLGDR